MNNGTLITLIIIFIGYFTYRFFMKKWITNKVVNDLVTRDFDSFDKHVNSIPSRLYIDKFNLEFIKLNAGFIKNDERMITDQIDKLIKCKKNEVQSKEVYELAFNYYVQQSNNKAREMLDELKKVCEPETYHPYEILQSIVLDKSDKYFDEVKSLLANADKDEQGMYHYMLSLMYGYRNDKKQEEKELKLAEDGFKNSATTNSFNKNIQ